MKAAYGAWLRIGIQTGMRNIHMRCEGIGRSKSRNINRKILAAVLAAVMVFAVPASVFAAGETGGSRDGAASSGITELAHLKNLRIDENPTGTAVLKWDKFEGAAYYTVSSPDVNDGEETVSEKANYTVYGLDHGVTYDFTVGAFDEYGEVIAYGETSITTVAYKINFNESEFRTLKSRTITPKKFNINLRSLIKEDSKGYAIVQGSCTDGTYAYYLMVSGTTQHGRVLKLRLKDNKVIARSKVVNTWHGNGMTYDSKRKKLVVIAREDRKQEITLIDAKTLRITRQENVRYNNKIDAGNKNLTSRFKKSGLAAIAYVRKYDCYIALERQYHNLLIFDPDTFECIGLAYTNLGSANPGTFQGMDADEKYVYLVLSYYSSAQPYNKLVVLDWNSEKLLPVVNASKSKDPTFVKGAWWCSNDGSGKPDASVRIRSSHEAESIYHTTDKNGREHFYMAEYYGHMAYKTVKKGKKKVRSWYYKRDNYVYDLGII